ncbi:MAG: hypothetical protein ACREFE_19210, partial [Limisphaerales bacterium]
MPRARRKKHGGWWLLFTALAIFAIVARMERTGRHHGHPRKIISPTPIALPPKPQPTLKQFVVENQSPKDFPRPVHD